jgi:hypothetical protein
MDDLANGVVGCAPSVEGAERFQRVRTLCRQVSFAIGDVPAAAFEDDPGRLDEPAALTVTFGQRAGGLANSASVKTSAALSHR